MALSRPDRRQFARVRTVLSGLRYCTESRIRRRDDALMQLDLSDLELETAARACGGRMLRLIVKAVEAGIAVRLQDAADSDARGLSI